MGAFLSSSDFLQGPCPEPATLGKCSRGGGGLKGPPPPRVTAQAPLRPDQKHAVTHVREVRFENMKLPFRIFKSSRFSLIQ